MSRQTEICPDKFVNLSGRMSGHSTGVILGLMGKASCNTEDEFTKYTCATQHEARMMLDTIAYISRHLGLGYSVKISGSTIFIKKRTGNMSQPPRN